MFQALRTLVEHPAGASATLVVGIVVLLLGGHWLVSGSVTIARRLGVSTLVVGLTVVAMGTSAPEFFFNVIAAFGDNTQLSFGNIIGSNIANIGLVLGVAAVYKSLTVDGRVVKKELPWLVVVSFAVLGLALMPGGDPVDRAAFSWIDGAIMMAWFVVFFVGWYRMGRREAADPLVRELGQEAEAETVGSLTGAVFLVVIGLACLVGGGKLSEQGAVAIAQILGLSQALIGLTIVAFATSLPELATAVIACRKGHDDLAVGNVVGSNVFNLLLVLGATALVAPVALPIGHGWKDLVVMIGITCVLMLMAFSHRRITRGEGALLLAGYVAYVSWVVGREI